MTTKTMSHYFLVFLIVVSLIIRLYQLEELPSILNRDEAGLAYNALLLKETGKDEWGRSWPLTLESFGDYKLPGYPLMLVGLFYLFEPSDFIVRIPAALAGVSLIALAYAFGRTSGWRQSSALTAAFVVATTPVFFFYSRIAFEALVGLALLLTALLLLHAPVYDFFQKRWLQDGVAIIAWLLASLTYNTPLLLIPLFIPVIVVARGSMAWKKWVVPVVGLMLVLGGLLTAQASLTSQKSGITIFSDAKHREIANTRYANFTGIAKPLIGNKYVYFVTVMTKNAVATFSPQFLLTRGGAHPLHQLPDNGHSIVTIYLFGIAGYVYALVDIIKTIRTSQKWTKMSKQHGFEILLLVTTLISLAPSIVTVDAPHATRSLLFFFCLAFSSVYAVSKLKKNIGILFVTVTILLFSQYVYEYFTEYPSRQPALLLPGFAEVISQVDATTQGEIAIVDPDGYQYISTAWYLRTEPREFLGTVVRQQPNWFGFRYGQQVGRYHFIGQLEDRSQTEKTVLEWNGTEWLVHHF